MIEEALSMDEQTDLNESKYLRERSDFIQEGESILNQSIESSFMQGNDKHLFDTNTSNKYFDETDEFEDNMMNTLERG